MARRLILPSTQDQPADEQSWVELNDELTVADYERFRDADTDGILATVVKGLAGWSFQDDLDLETVQQLPAKDFLEITRQLFRSPVGKGFEVAVIRAFNGGSDEENPPPWEVTSYRYRRLMGISEPELKSTSWQTVQKDIAIHNIETQLEAAKSPQGAQP